MVLLIAAGRQTLRLVVRYLRIVVEGLFRSLVLKMSRFWTPAGTNVDTLTPGHLLLIRTEGISVRVIRMLSQLVGFDLVERASIKFTKKCKLLKEVPMWSCL